MENNIVKRDKKKSKQLFPQENMFISYILLLHNMESSQYEFLFLVTDKKKTQTNKQKPWGKNALLGSWLYSYNPLQQERYGSTITKQPIMLCLVSRIRGKEESWCWVYPLHPLCTAMLLLPSSLAHLWMHRNKLSRCASPRTMKIELVCVVAWCLVYHINSLTRVAIAYAYVCLLKTHSSHLN